MRIPFQLPRENLIVYGLGGAFHWFHEIFMVDMGYRPEYLADRKCQGGDVYEGIPVTSNLSARIGASERHRYTVIVCTGTENSFAGIRGILLSQGFVQVLWIHQIYEIHDPFGLSRDVFTDDVPPEQERNIEAARRLFQDNLSRNVFDRFIETHLTKTPVVIPQSPPDEQYFPRDIDIKIALDRMVLCGSDIHDLIRLPRKIDSPIESLISFEADPYLFRKISNHRFLEEQIGSLNEMTRSLILSPCAISSSTGIRPFKSGNRASDQNSCNTFGSRLHPSGADLVQTISLDQAIHGIEPTYVCMDIEGEELEAISGTQRIIRSSRTQLAVSVYHKASHIWEIPNLIFSLNQNYTFYLRNYTGFCNETILYATI